MKTRSLVASLLIVASAFAGDGHWWIKLNHEQKTFYAGGVHDGMLCILRANGREELADALLGPSCGDMDAWADGLDLFYSDFRNRNILVADAVLPVAFAINGLPPEKIADSIATLRARSLSQYEKEKQEREAAAEKY